MLLQKPYDETALADALKSVTGGGERKLDYASERARPAEDLLAAALRPASSALQYRTRAALSQRHRTPVVPLPAYGGDLPNERL